MLASELHTAPPQHLLITRKVITQLTQIQHITHNNTQVVMDHGQDVIKNMEMGRDEGLRFPVTNARLVHVFKNDP